MKFPYTSLCFLGMLFLGLMFLRCNTEPKASVEGFQEERKTYTLKVERSAFHYDSFILKDDTLRYIPQERSDHPNALYNRPTQRILDSAVTNNLIRKIVHDGFWQLDPTYKSSSSCTSPLKITLQVNEKSKTVICDDFVRDCPELIKYIDQKVVELEGNGLKRIYLPG